MDKNIFQSPKGCKALDQAQSPFWFWNDKLEDEEILRQLRLMTEAGVACATPHARSGYIGDYMTEEWFGRLQTVIDYKKEHDEPMWLYDEFNWPAGSCNGAVSREEGLRERYLYFTRYEVPVGSCSTPICGRLAFPADRRGTLIRCPKTSSATTPKRWSSFR